MSTPPRFVPLGDQAVLAYLPDEAAAVAFAAAVRAANPPWLQDVVPGLRQRRRVLRRGRDRVRRR